MPEILQVTQGVVRVDAVAELDNGVKYQTSIVFPSVSEYESASTQQKTDMAVAQITSELRAIEPQRAVELRECDELLAAIHNSLTESGIYTVEQAEQHEYWSVILSRGLLTVECALRRAMSPVVTEDVTALWLGVASKVAMVEILGDPEDDYSIDSQISQWLQWSSENGIDL